MMEVLNKTLEEIRPIVKNKANEVSVCKDIYSNEKFVMVRLVDRELTKRILGLLYAPNGQSLLPRELFVGSEVFKGQMLLLFNYVPERELLAYIRSESAGVTDTTRIIRDLIISYFALKVAPPIKRLIINEGNINIKPGGRVYFGTLFDFDELDLNCEEKDCTEQVISVINKLLLEFDVTGNKDYKEAKSIKLFFKKYKNNTYDSLIEVYNDFKLDDGFSPKTGLGKLKAFFGGGRLIKIGKIILMATVFCMLCVIANWLLEKSTFVIGFKNSNLDLIGTVDMTSG